MGSQRRILFAPQFTVIAQQTFDDLVLFSRSSLPVVPRFDVVCSPHSFIIYSLSEQRFLGFLSSRSMEGN